MRHLLKHKHILRGGIVVVVCCIVGIAYVVYTRAASPNIPFDLEKGAVTKPALIGSDTTASGSQYVSFGGAAPKNKFYGVVNHPVWQTFDYQDKSMALMVEAGVQAVRIDLPWNSLEATKGTFHPTYLSRIDYAVNGLLARGIEPLLIVLNTPPWANGGSSDPHLPPVNNQDYLNYFGFWINRYAGKVNAYEIWNEPDGRWAWTNPDPVRYTALLKSAYTYAKSVNPNLVILGGSLSNTGVIQQNFLKTMYQQGAKNYFDILSQHGYGDPPSHGNLAPEIIFDNFSKYIAPIMQANGDSAKRIWWTETGYNTNVAFGGVTETVQADYLTRSYKKAATIPNLDRLYNYNWTHNRDNTTSTNSEDYYGLIDPYKNPPWRKKPAFEAFKNLATAP